MARLFGIFDYGHCATIRSLLALRMKRFLNEASLGSHRGCVRVILRLMMLRLALSRGRHWLASLTSSEKKVSKGAIRVLSGECMCHRSCVGKGWARLWWRLRLL